MSENNQETPKAVPNTKTPPFEGDARNPVLVILEQIEEMRLRIDALGRGDDKLVDIIVARLLSNNTFFERLATAMQYRAALIKQTAESNRQRTAVPSPHIPGGVSVGVDLSSDGEETNKEAKGDPATVRHTTLSTVMAGYYEFEGAEGMVIPTIGSYKITVESQNEGEDAHIEEMIGIVSATIYPYDSRNSEGNFTKSYEVVRVEDSAFPFALSGVYDENVSEDNPPPSSQYVSAIVQAVQGSYQFVTESMKKDPEFRGQIDRFWYKVSNFTPYDQADQG